MVGGGGGGDGVQCERSVKNLSIFQLTFGSFVSCLLSGC